ncbi:hypothetical protein QE152_g19256 [Popillia japonica]|uniref:Uncharacterized protein n=1 Tax=Popillia japonica TaxID=7064 RepID=A0AAW1KUZ3_POPJA
MDMGTKSSAKNDPSINFTSFSGACDIDAFITVKIKHAINLITEEVINVLKSEIAKLNMNNCHLTDEVNKLRNEVNNLNNENSILKNELQLFIRKRPEDGSSHSHANKINNINNPDQKAKQKLDNKKNNDENKNGKENTNFNKKDYASAVRGAGNTISSDSIVNIPEIKKPNHN